MCDLDVCFFLFFYLLLLLFVQRLCMNYLILSYSILLCIHSIFCLQKNTFLTRSSLRNGAFAHIYTETNISIEVTLTHRQGLRLPILCCLGFHRPVFTNRVIARTKHWVSHFSFHSLHISLLFNESA